MQFAFLTINPAVAFIEAQTRLKVNLASEELKLKKHLTYRDSVAPACSLSGSKSRQSDGVEATLESKGTLPALTVPSLPSGEKMMVNSTNRQMFPIATAVFVLLSVTNGSFAVTASADSPHAAHMLKCATICADCLIQCDSCSNHCAKLVGEGKKEHAKCMSLCVDCAECCKMCASLCARQSDLCAHACECCSKCCDDCAAACEKFPDDKQMAACAKSCRNCAKECTAMAKMMK